MADLELGVVYFLLKEVVLPDPRLNTHSPIYNPGGPGTDLSNQITFTEPNGGQIIAIENAIKNPK